MPLGPRLVVILIQALCEVENIPKVHSNSLIGANIANGVDRRSALLHLCNDARGTSSGSHEESEAKERTVPLRISRWRLAIVFVSFPVCFTVPW